MNGYLLDTNVVSELRKPRPNDGLRAWLEAIAEDLLFLSCLTLGKLRLGIELVRDEDKRRDPDTWLVSDLARRFGRRILTFDGSVSDRWGRIEARARRTGVRLPAIDGMLAATASHHELTIVTRNQRDFLHNGVNVVNPWR